MDYENTFSCGSPKRALRMLAERLVGMNFRIEDQNDHLLRVVGPGMNSMRGNPLLNITRAEIRVESDGLYMAARMGEVTRLFVRVLAWVFASLVIVFSVLPILVSARSFPNSWIWHYFAGVTGALAVNLLVWLVLLPIIARAQRRKTIGAVENLFGSLEKP